MRTCSLEGCEDKHYAKGWCFGHYKRDRNGGRFHCDGCGTLLGKAQQRWCAPCARTQGRRSERSRRRRQSLRQRREWQTWRECAVCGGLFWPNHHRRKICRDCAFGSKTDYHRWWRTEVNPEAWLETNRASRDARRARLAEVEHERFWRRTIYQRDGWVCQICLEPVDPDAEYPDPMSASLDHVVPISEGGPHTKANSRLAHWICNVMRGAGGGNEQLRLVG